jgi:hypothetical protein
MVKSNKLTKEELKHLVGGSYTMALMNASPDSQNGNVIYGCNCCFSNNGVIPNHNNVMGCVCNC